jgi:hypothetical protein
MKGTTMSDETPHDPPFSDTDDAKDESPSPPIQVDSPDVAEAPPTDVVDNVVSGEEDDVEVSKNQDPEPDLEDEDV